MRGRDLGEERLRLGLRLGAELLPQHLSALLVRLQRRFAAPLNHVQAHEGAVRFLLQRIDEQQLSRGHDGRRDQPGLPLMRQELSMGVEGELVEPIALVAQPVFEGLIACADAGQEIPPVEDAGALQCLGAALVREPLELQRIDQQTATVQRDAAGIAEKDRRQHRVQG